VVGSSPLLVAGGSIFSIDWKILWVSVAEKNFFQSFHKNILNKGRLNKGLREMFLFHMN